MHAHLHNAVFATVTGTVTSVAVDRAAGGSGPGDGLSTLIVVGESLISLAYWRLMREGIVRVSSIEDGQRLGGPPIDAVGELELVLVGRHCLGIAIDTATGDLRVSFSGDVLLQALRFRSLFEDWEVRLPDGGAYWSNMVELHR